MQIKISTNKFYEDLDIDDFFPQYEAECQGCDMWGPVDDIGLCTDCAGKLERDMIRQRDWVYFTLAFGCPKDKDEDCNLKMLIYDWPEFGHWVDVTAINGNTMTIQNYSVNAKVTYNPSNGSVDFFLPKILRWPARILMEMIK